MSVETQNVGIVTMHSCLTSLSLRTSRCRYQSPGLSWMNSRMAPEVKLEIGLGLYSEFFAGWIARLLQNRKDFAFLFFSLGSCAERVGVSNLQNQNRNNFTNAVNL